MKFTFFFALLAMIICASVIEARHKTAAKQVVVVNPSYRYTYSPWGYRVYSPYTTVVSAPVYWRTVYWRAMKRVAKRLAARRNRQ